LLLGGWPSVLRMHFSAENAREPLDRPLADERLKSYEI
jgi:hypothetical protein